VQETAARGFVALVGAGPGDPGLLTVRGRELLEQADAVVYDALASPKLLELCKPTARLIDAGKRAADHRMTQEQINDLLVRLGREGLRVVRLKGGDPFVFGRGGEEAEALAAAGVAFEVVPGVTAAIAACAYAGIPVTHRDFNSSFTLITGQEREDAFRDEAARGRTPGEGSRIDWAAIARLPCVAFYMGVKSLPRVTQSLIEHGMDPAIPAAVIQWGTTPRQRTVVATLTDIAQRAAEAGIGAPAIVIIGRVVQMRQTIGWFEKRPLFGQTIVVTRTRHQASALSARLAELGAQVLEAPTIEIAPAADTAAVNAAIDELRTGAFDWLVFTSANGVSTAREALWQRGLDARALAGLRIAVIGRATAEALRQMLSIEADLASFDATAEGLADELARRGAVTGRRFLLLRADIGRPVLVERLQAGGAARVADVAIYQTRPATALPPAVVEAIRNRQVNWITFTSSSTVRNFMSLLGDDDITVLQGVRLASIGPVTSRTLRDLGLEPAIQSPAADVLALAEAIAAAVAQADMSGKGHRS